MTTAIKLSPGEMLDRLQELLKAATEYAAAEARMERLFAEIRAHEDDLVDGRVSFETAVHGEVMCATRPLNEDDRSALGICQEIQDAIDILKFAIERSDDAR